MKVPVLLKFNDRLQKFGSWGVLLVGKQKQNYWPYCEDKDAVFYLSNTGKVVPVGKREANLIYMESEL